MKIILIIGSRTLDGQTGRAAKAFLQGAGEKGCKCETILLPQMKIERCRQCDNDGWGICRTEGRCIIEDDFVSIVDKIKNADMAVFVTPVYFSDLSESMRSFLDRLRRITRHETGQKGISGKPALGICVAGGKGGGAPICAMILEKILLTAGFDVLDMIPVRRQNLEMKLDVLQNTGKWIGK